MPASLPELLVRTARGVAARWRVLGLCVVVLAVFSVASQGLEAWRLQLYEAQSLDDAAVQRDVSALESLTQARRAGDTSVDGRIAEIRGRISSRLSILSGTRSPVAYWLEVGPVLLVSWGIGIVALLSAFALGIRSTAAGSVSGWRAAVTDIRRSLRPLAQATAGMIGVSLLWIPLLAIVFSQFQRVPLSGPAATAELFLVFIGYLGAVVLLPRLALAPLILLDGDVTPATALRRSMEATRGYWGKILGNTFALGFGLLIVSFTVLQAFSDLSRSPLFLALPRAILLQTSVVILGAFLSHLGRSILAHPEPRAEEAWEDGPHLAVTPGAGALAR